MKKILLSIVLITGLMLMSFNSTNSNKIKNFKISSESQIEIKCLGSKTTGYGQFPGDSNSWTTYNIIILVNGSEHSKLESIIKDYK